MEEALEKVQRPKAIFFQAHETSTGARLPVEELTSVIKSRAKDALVVVDAISSLGAHTLSMQTMGIDCVVSGSQKGFGVGPGLSFIALSERGWQSLSERPRFYFDLSRERKGQEAGAGRTAFTPAVGLIMGLEAALLEIHKIGVEQFVDHHRRMGEAARAAVQALGLELFVEEVAYSNALTAIKVPDGMDGVRILTTAKTRYGAIISGGQDDLKGKIIRFSHLGFVSPFLLLEGLAALEFALADEGHRFVLGSGVARAMQVLHRH